MDLNLLGDGMMPGSCLSMDFELDHEIDEVLQGCFLASQPQQPAHSGQELLHIPLEQEQQQQEQHAQEEEAAMQLALQELQQLQQQPLQQAQVGQMGHGGLQQQQQPQQQPRQPPAGQEVVHITLEQLQQLQQLYQQQPQQQPQLQQHALSGSQEVVSMIMQELQQQQQQQGQPGQEVVNMIVHELQHQQPQRQHAHFGRGVGHTATLQPQHALQQHQHQHQVQLQLQQAQQRHPLQQRQLQPGSGQAPDVAAGDPTMAAAKRKAKEPSKAQTAFAIYKARYRGTITLSQPSLSIKDTNALLKQMWEALPGADRQHFEAAAAAAEQLRCQQELQEYQQHAGVAPAGLGVAGGGPALGLADDDGEGQDQEPLAKKRKRDPGAPVKAKTAYILFTTDHRRALGREVGFSTATKLCAEAWKAAPQEVKAHYAVLAEREKVDYLRKKEEYDTRQKLQQARARAGVAPHVVSAPAAMAAVAAAAAAAASMVGPLPQLLPPHATLPMAVAAAHGTAVALPPPAGSGPMLHLDATAAAACGGVAPSCAPLLLPQPLGLLAVDGLGGGAQQGLLGGQQMVPLMPLVPQQQQQQSLQQQQQQSLQQQQQQQQQQLAAAPGLLGMVPLAATVGAGGLLPALAPAAAAAAAVGSGGGYCGVGGPGLVDHLAVLPPAAGCGLGMGMVQYGALGHAGGVAVNQVGGVDMVGVGGGVHGMGLGGNAAVAGVL